MQPTVRLRMSRLYRYHAAGTVGERVGSCHGLEPSPIDGLPATDGGNLHWVCRTEGRAEEPLQALTIPGLVIKVDILNRQPSARSSIVSVGSSRKVSG